MRKLTRKNLDDLAATMQVMSEDKQRRYVGGADSSYCYGADYYGGTDYYGDTGYYGDTSYYGGEGYYYGAGYYGATGYGGSSYYGGYSGTTYTQEEYNALVTSGVWSGGMVNGMGYIFEDVTIIGNLEHCSVKISVKRNGYGNDTTVSTFSAIAYDATGSTIKTITGYMLEPRTDTSLCTTRGSDTAIQAGTYGVVKVAATGRYTLVNVPGRTGIQIHSGNNGGHTSGCLLVGSSMSYGNGDFNIPGGSVTATKALEKLMDTYGRGGIAIDIY